MGGGKDRTQEDASHCIEMFFESSAAAAGGWWLWINDCDDDDDHRLRMIFIDGAVRKVPVVLK